MRQQTRSATSDRRHHRIRSALVVTEVALAVVLLIGAGLLVRTFSNLSRVDLGFQPAGMVTAGLFLGLRPPDTRVAVLDQILDRVESLPGVQAAGTIQFLPLRGAACATGFWNEEDAEGRDLSRTHPTECGLVSRGILPPWAFRFWTAARSIAATAPGSSRVLIVNQAFARQYSATVV